MPFARAAQELAFFWQVPVSASTARRHTEAAGAAYVAVQTEAVVARERGVALPASAGPPCQFLSADGAMVPLVGGEWAEVKTLAIGTIAEPVPAGAASGGQTTELTYFSRLTDQATFARLATVETHRRGVSTAGTVVAVTDGSPWLQDFIAYHRADAVRVLDFPHAVEHLTTAAQATFGVGSDQATVWVTRQAHTLKHDDPMTVVLALLDLPTRTASDPQAAALARRATLRYLVSRWDAIQYAQFQAQGYPIGDGAIESANKLVPEARLKGGGMRWARGNVDPMVALRTVAYNDRWAEAWAQIHPQCQTRHRHTGHRRQARQAAPARAEAPPTTLLPAAVPTRRSTAIPKLSPERTKRPHPWSYQARVAARALPSDHART
jgi:hypothetical protein